MSRPREPIPVAPFLSWCETREAQIRRELDACPEITSRREGYGGPARHDTRARLVMELGWDIGTGERRLHRWRDDGVEVVERATIEEALHHADVLFETVYPDLEPAHWSYATRLGKTRYTTDAQLLAAHTVYVRGRLTIEQVAGLLYERLGYKNPRSAARCLIHGWHSLGLRRRECRGARQEDGTKCRKAPCAASDYCIQHDPAIAVGWTIPAEMASRARAMYESGDSFRVVGARLHPETPWSHPAWTAQRLAGLAAEQGWHRTRRARVAA